MKKITRRTALKASLAAGSLVCMPSFIKAASPNGKIGTAHIAIGGKGKSDLSSMASHPNVEVVGLCDVDTALRENAMAEHPSARFFQDYREMLDQLGDRIDAVTVSTPDHTHYPATLAAMERGIHTYTQKPLTHTMAEARHLRDYAEEHGLVTQMGIQNHARQPYRAATMLIQDGVIGKISKVYAWSFKNWGYDGEPYAGEDPIPETLDWNLWLGTAAERPYLAGKYHTKDWRRILDYGCGTLGDMGVHIIDTPFRALELEPAISAKTACRAPNGFSHPEKNIVEYGFAPTKYTTDDFSFTWYDGAHCPPTGEADLELPDGAKLPTQGSLFVGERGRMVLPHCSQPTFYPATVLDDIEVPKLSDLNHYHQFIDAIEGKDRASADFRYAAKIMETLHLGVIAAQFPERTLEWDTQTMKVPNVAEANRLTSKEYRRF